MFLMFSSVILSQTEVEVFRYEDDERVKMVEFPEGNQSYERIIMEYSLRCHDLAVGNGNIGCREWDYHCNTVLTDSSRVDSILANHPSHTVQNFSGDVYEYTTAQGYRYTQYTQFETTAGPNQSPQVYFVGADEASSPRVISTDQASGRSVFIYTASELSAAGLTAGPIGALDIKITEEGGTAQFFKIRMAHSSSDQLSPAEINTTDYTEVYHSDVQFGQAGDQRMLFHTDFNWDGSSHLVIEFSHYNGQAGGEETPLACTMVDSRPGLVNTRAGASVEFDGTGRLRLETAKFEAISKYMTIAFWSFGDAQILPANTFAFEGVDSAGNRQVSSHLPWSNGRIYWDCGNDGSGYDRVEEQASMEQFSAGWNHWAFTKNAGSGIMRIYNNGNLFATGSSKRKLIDILDFFIGKNASDQTGYFGKIDEFSIWSNELATIHVREIMYNPPTESHPRYSSLLSYYDFDEMQGNGFEDKADTPGGGASIEGNVRHDQNRGEEAFFNWAPISMRPVLKLVQGSLDKSSTVKNIIDSIPINPREVVFFEVDGTDLIRVDTQYLWDAGDVDVYNRQGEVVGSRTIAKEGQIEIQTLEYYHKTPARYELLSFITPYGNGLDLGPDGVTFRFDMTDYTPILKGRKRISIEGAGRNQEEYDVRFLFYEGTPPREVLAVQEIWPINGSGQIWSGRTANAIGNDRVFEPRDVQLDPGAEGYKLRSAVTGHGQNGEFVAKTHYLRLQNPNHEFRYLVWKECADNPIYPQGGTWIFDRAGWCPGDGTDVHEFEITDLVTPGQLVNIDYGIDAIIGFPNADYRISNQLVTYGPIQHERDARIENVIKPGKEFEFDRYNPSCSAPEIIIRNTGSEIIETLDIEYYVEGQTDKTTFTWEGNLAFDETERLVLPEAGLNLYALNPGEHELVFQIVSINGSPDDYPGNNQKRAAFEMPVVYSDSEILLHYETNTRGGESNLTVRDAEGNEVFSRGNMANSKSYFDFLELEPGCYSIEFTDSGDDGLYFWYWDRIGQPRGRGYFRIIQDDIVKIEFNPDFGKFFWHEFVVSKTTSAEQLNHEYKIRMLPNPAIEQCVVELKGPEGQDYRLRLTDAAGQELWHSHKFTINESGYTGIQIERDGIPPGMYWVQLITDKGKALLTRKLIWVD